MKKGNWFYEIQILMFVFMWQHTDFSYIDEFYFAPKEGFWLWRLHIWRDSCWMMHGFPYHLRIWIYRIMNDTIPGLRFGIFLSNIKLRWIRLKLKIVRAKLFFHSLNNYLRLYKAGFRIAHSNLSGLEINRFYWNDKVIEDMADIDHPGRTGHYNTVFLGHVKRLN